MVRLTVERYCAKITIEAETAAQALREIEFVRALPRRCKLCGWAVRPPFLDPEHPLQTLERHLR